MIQHLMFSIDYILVSFISVIAIIILDHRWMKDINFSKAEKGMEVMEHYHWGLILVIIGIVLWQYTNLLSVGLLIAGITFIACESKQKNDFALNSTHAIPSTIIGVSLLIVTIMAYLFSI